MFFLKTMIRSIQDDYKLYGIYSINIIVVILFYNILYGKSEFLYPIVISVFFMMVLLITKTLDKLSIINKLSIAENSPNYIYKTSNSTYQKFFIVISKLHKKYNSEIFSLKQEQEEKINFFSQWIHNMKTSVTIFDMIVEENTACDNYPIYLEHIKSENKKLNMNLEQGLQFIRFDSFSNDYMLENIKLLDIVKDTINKYKLDFIYSNVFPKADIDNDVYIQSDYKWCSYIIGQIISNSIKYSDNDNSEIKIYNKVNNDKVDLIIEDYGIGIEKTDLKRVFDLFFTGNNGRINNNSTGIGLYMCKMICDKLGHNISIDSKKETGTIVTISFLTKM